MFALSEEDVREIRKIASKAGFKNEADFVKKAVEDKILEFKKLLFSDITSDVRRSLENNRITQEEVLQDFDRSRSG